MESTRDFLEPGSYPRGNISAAPSFPRELSPTAFPGASYVDNAASASLKSQPLFPDMRRDEFLSKSTISTKEARATNQTDNWSVTTSSVEHFRSDKPSQNRDQQKYHDDESRHRKDHARHSPRESDAFTTRRVGRSLERRRNRQSLDNQPDDFRHNERSRERRIPERPDDDDTPTRSSQFQDYRRQPSNLNRNVDDSYSRYSAENGEFTGSVERASKDFLLRDESVNSYIRRPQQTYDDDYHMDGRRRIRYSHENDGVRNRPYRNVDERRDDIFPRSPLNERNEREMHGVKAIPTRENFHPKGLSYQEPHYEGRGMDRPFFDPQRQGFQPNIHGRWNDDARFRYPAANNDTLPRISRPTGNMELDDGKGIRQSFFDMRGDYIQPRSPAPFYHPAEYQSYQNSVFSPNSSRQVGEGEFLRGQFDSRDYMEYPPESSGIIRDRLITKVPIFSEVERNNEVPVDLEHRRPYLSPTRYHESPIDMEYRRPYPSPTRYHESPIDMEYRRPQHSPTRHRVAVDNSSRYQDDRLSRFEEKREHSWSPRTRSPRVNGRNIYQSGSYSDNDDEMDSREVSGTALRQRGRSLDPRDRYRHSGRERSLSPGVSRRQSKSVSRTKQFQSHDYSDSDAEDNKMFRGPTNSRNRGSSRERRERGELVGSSRSKTEYREKSRLRGKTYELSDENIPHGNRAFHFDLASMERGRRRYEDDTQSNSSVSSLNVERGTSRHLDDDNFSRSKSQLTREIELKLPSSRIKVRKPLEFVIDVGKVIDEDKEVTFSPSTDIPPQSLSSSVSQSQGDHLKRIADATLLKEQSQARHQILKEIRQAMEMRDLTQDLADRKFWDRQVDSLNVSLKTLWESHKSANSTKTKPQNYRTATTNDVSYNQENNAGSGLEYQESTASDHELASKMRTGHTVLNNYTTVKVQAPENLAEGHQFTVRINGKPHTVQVPQGGVQKGDIFSIRIPLNPPSTPENAASTVVKVRAPASLPEGYRFTAKMGDRTIVATVPKGGVQKGEIFSVRVPE